MTKLLQAYNNSDTSPETLSILATDEDWYIRRGVARNPNTSPETLQVLATDENYYVRYYVARHSNSTELIRRLVLMTDAQEK